jgi:hypothetical protein
VQDEVNEFVQRARGGGTLPVELALRMRFNPRWKAAGSAR